MTISRVVLVEQMGGDGVKTACEDIFFKEFAHEKNREGKALAGGTQGGFFVLFVTFYFQ